MRRWIRMLIASATVAVALAIPTTASAAEGDGWGNQVKECTGQTYGALVSSGEFPRLHGNGVRGFVTDNC